MYVYNFELKKDYTKNLELSPWAFIGTIMVIHRMNHNVPVKEMDFNTGLFLVQIHDLPIPKYPHKNVEKVVALVGALVNIDAPDFEYRFRRNFLRIRATIDLSNPLKIGFALKRIGGSLMWISFKYERLNGLCYICGIIGHNKEHCRKPLSTNRFQERYGPWLRANLSKSNMGSSAQSEKENGCWNFKIQGQKLPVNLICHQRIRDKPYNGVSIWTTNKISLHVRVMVCHKTTAFLQLIR